MSKNRHFLAGALVVLFALAGSQAQASLSLQFRADFDRENDFHVQMQVTYNHFHPADRDLERAAAILSKPEDMAVVFFLAKQAGVRVDTILNRRSRGEAWYAIMVAFNIPISVLYPDVPESVGPPYGKAHGYHKRRFQTEPSFRQLDDSAVAELVMYQVTMSQLRADPYVVATARRGGKSYAQIQGEMYRNVGLKRPLNRPLQAPDLLLNSAVMRPDPDHGKSKKKKDKDR